MPKKVSRGSTPHRLSRPSTIFPSPGLHYDIDAHTTPLDSFTPSFSELSDSLVDLDSNIQQIQRVHESLTSFNESFSSFLYGLQINAYTVEFNELPQLKNFKNDEIREKIAKLEEYFSEKEAVPIVAPIHADDTYLTNDDDGSFIAHPTTTTAKSGNPVSKSKIPRRRSTVVPTGLSGGIHKPTKASKGRRRSQSKRDERPPFR